MKFYLMIPILGLLFIALNVWSFQAQTPQQKVQPQGALKLGETQKRTLAPEAIHVWDLALVKGQYGVVEVEQKGIDVVVRIVDPQGVRKSEIDSPTGTAGTEKATWITNLAGTWKIELVPLDATQAGDYEIKWVTLREATETDRQIIIADSLNSLAQTYDDQGKYAEAEPLYQRALAIREKTLSAEHSDVAASLNNLAALYRAQGRYGEAEPLYQRSLAIFEKALGAEHPDVAICLNNLALLYYDQGRYGEAEPLFRRSLAIQEKVLGAEHPDVANSLNNLAGLYDSQGRYSEAEPLFRSSLAIWEKALGTEHPKVATSLSNLASLYNAQGRYEEAEPLYRRSLAIREKALGAEHPDVAISLNNLAGFYLAQGRYGEAERLFRRSLAILEKVLGAEHPQVATSLNNLAELYRDQGRYGEAEPLYQRSLAILEKALGAEHPDVAICLNNLALLYHDQGRYGEAEPLYRRGLAIREKILGAEHREVAASLNDLAVLYRDQGRYGEAEPLYRRSLAIGEKVLGAEHPEVTVSLNNLAALYRAQGRYDEAEPLYRRSLAIREKALGVEHPRVATSLNNLALLYDAQGRYGEAEPLFRRSLAIREKVLGAEHPDVAASLNNLATLYYAQGRYGEAEPLFRRSLAIHEKALGTEHPDVATSLNNLAAFYLTQGRYGEVEPLYRRSLAIWEKALGAEHPLVATSLNNLADLYHDQGRDGEAEPLYQRSLAIREKALGAEHPNVVLSLYNLATLYSDSDKHQEALIYIDKALKVLPKKIANPELFAKVHYRSALIHKKLSNHTLALNHLAAAANAAEQMRPQVGGGEETRAAFFQKYVTLFDQMIAWQLEKGDLEKAIEYAERSQARTLLDQLAAGKIDLRISIPADLRQEIETRESQALAKKTEYQQQITVLRSRQDLTEAEKQRMLQGLEQKRNEAEKAYQAIYEEIKNASPLWRDLLTSGGKPEPLFNIQSRLIPRQGRMLMYQIGEKESFLFIVPPLGQPAVSVPLQINAEQSKLLGISPGPLTSEKLQQILAVQNAEVKKSGLIQILSRASRNVKPLDQPKPSLIAEKLHALWQALIPDTLWQRVKTCEDVIIIPDDALNLLPFEALVVSYSDKAANVRYWLDEGPPLRYAASATVLYNIEQRPAARIIPSFTQPQVLSLSDPIYDLAEVHKATQQAAAMPDSTRREGSFAAASLESRGEILRNQYERIGGALQRLPGTARETSAISQVYPGQGAHPELVTLQQSAANEFNLRHHLPGKRYVHLGTHGIVDQQRRIAFASLVLTPSLQDSVSSQDDGFLELHEIYQLQLPECELAVLSACETNVGRYVEGEGVFALTRGFLAAGTRRVIASQWPVDDASTAEIIGEFFRQIAAAEKAGKPLNYTKALRDAKLKVRQQEKWAEPFYWAPFVITGKR